MSKIDLRDLIIDAFDVDRVTDNYDKPVVITDLKDALKTKGHLFVVRGDLALVEELSSPELATPKMWVYENLIRSERIKLALEEQPTYRLFDGVGFSGHAALGFHANQIGRKAVVVMARELLPEKNISDRWDIEVIHGDLPAELGYIRKQADVLSRHTDLIPCHQALYGAQALAPIGNVVVDEVLGRYNIQQTFWSIAGGSSLYGVGVKMKNADPNIETVVVEPETEMTINPAVDLRNPDEVKGFVREKLTGLSSLEFDGVFSGIFPLHVFAPNRYLLHLWGSTGEVGFDRVQHVSLDEVSSVQTYLRTLSEDWHWTRSTALSFVPAIQSAREGKNVLVMAYGKHRPNKSRLSKIIGQWESESQ